MIRVSILKITNIPTSKTKRHNHGRKHYAMAIFFYKHWILFACILDARISQTSTFIRSVVHVPGICIVMQDWLQIQNAKVTL
jgi:hypothetical protein